MKMNQNKKKNWELESNVNSYGNRKSECGDSWGNLKTFF
jgi:hypothetical protein